MSKKGTGTGFGEHIIDDHIRDILRDYDIEVKVNLNSFTFWVLQYSGCVEVLDTGKKGDDSYRNHIKEMLRKALGKYEEDEK